MAIPKNPGRVTDRQLWFITKLYREAFAAGYCVGYDTTHPERNCRTKTEASAEIERLLKAKSNGWKNT